MNPRLLIFLILFPVLIALAILLLAGSTAHFAAPLPLVPAGLTLAAIVVHAWPRWRRQVLSDGYILDLRLYLTLYD